MPRIFSGILAGDIGHLDPDSVGRKAPSVRSELIGAARSLGGMLSSSMNSSTSTNARGMSVGNQNQVPTTRPTHGEIFRTKTFNLLERTLSSPSPSPSKGQSENGANSRSGVTKTVLNAAQNFMKPVNLEANKRRVTAPYDSLDLFHPNEADQLRITICLSIIKVMQLANINERRKAAKMNDNDIRLIHERIFGFGENHCKQWRPLLMQFYQVLDKFDVTYVAEQPIYQ